MWQRSAQAKLLYDLHNTTNKIYIKTDLLMIISQIKIEFRNSILSDITNRSTPLYNQAQEDLASTGQHQQDYRH